MGDTYRSLHMVEKDGNWIWTAPDAEEAWEEYQLHLRAALEAAGGAEGADVSVLERDRILGDVLTCRMSRFKGNRIAGINEHGRELLGLGSRNRISSPFSSTDRDPTQHDPHVVARLTEDMSLAMERAQRAEEAALRAEMRNE